MKTEMIIRPQNMAYSNVKAFFTTRALNDNANNLSGEFEMPEAERFLPIQRHTNKIIVLEDDFTPRTGDAVLTKRKEVLIGIHVADCVPILLYDKKKSVVGAVHAGWRGTAAEILRNTIKTMQEKFHSSSEDIHVAIGPSIRQCCYDVGDDVKDVLLGLTDEGECYRRENGRWFVDLSAVNKIQALSMGVPEENIWQSDECTCCNPDRFYSYRYARGTAGRQGGFIGMW